MIKVTFPKDLMIDIIDDDYKIVKDTIVENSRWSIHHEIVFEHEGKFYRTMYSVGATEYQDEGPWEYENEVECIEVEKKLVQVERWVPK